MEAFWNCSNTQGFPYFARSLRWRIAFSILKAFNRNIGGAPATLIHCFSFAVSLASRSFGAAARHLLSGVRRNC